MLAALFCLKEILRDIGTFCYSDCFIEKILAETQTIHAWSYDLSGNLKNVPHQEQFKNFNKEIEPPLSFLNLETNFYITDIFVNLVVVLAVH